jgi:epoxyqueuosine reductase QueG
MNERQGEHTRRQVEKQTFGEEKWNSIRNYMNQSFEDILKDSDSKVVVTLPHSEYKIEAESQLDKVVKTSVKEHEVAKIRLIKIDEDAIKEEESVYAIGETFQLLYRWHIFLSNHIKK